MANDGDARPADPDPGRSDSTEIGPSDSTEIGPSDSTEIGPSDSTEIGPSDSTEIGALLDEIAHLRGRLADAPRRVHSLEERLLETKGQLAQAIGQNEKLSYTLREAREHIATLRDEVDKLSQPPSAYGVVVGKNDDDTVDILTSGRKMRVGPASRHRPRAARPRRRGRVERELQRGAGT